MRFFDYDNDGDPDLILANGHPDDMVVQLYVRHLNSSVPRPLKELKEFERIQLAPQEEKTVHFSLPAARLAYCDAQNDRPLVEKDEVEIMVGRSSVDARLRKTIRVR